MSGHNSDISWAAAYTVLEMAMAENLWSITSTDIRNSGQVQKLAGYYKINFKKWQ